MSLVSCSLSSVIWIVFWLVWPTKGTLSLHQRPRQEVVTVDGVCADSATYNITPPPTDGCPTETHRPVVCRQLVSVNHEIKHGPGKYTQLFALRVFSSLLTDVNIRPFCRLSEMSAYTNCRQCHLPRETSVQWKNVNVVETNVLCHQHPSMSLSQTDVTIIVTVIIPGKKL